MATVNAALVFRGNYNVPVVRSRANKSEILNSGAASVEGEIIADRYEYWVITASGNDVWVKFGPPGEIVVEAGGDWLIPNGGTREFQAVRGDTYAVVDG